MSKATKSSFQVAVNITLFTNHAIKASSLEEALEIARKLQLKDVVEFHGDYIDGSIDVTGVYE